MYSITLGSASLDQYGEVIKFIDYWNKNYFHSYKFVIGYTKWNNVYDSDGRETDWMILDFSDGSVGFIFDKNLPDTQYYAAAEACYRSYFMCILKEYIFDDNSLPNDLLELFIKWFLTDKCLNDVFNKFSKSIEDFMNSSASNEEKNCIIKLVDALGFADSEESAINCLKNLWNYLIRNNFLKNETRYIANYIASSVVKNVQWTSDVKRYIFKKFNKINTQASDLGYYLLYN